MKIVVVLFDMDSTLLEVGRFIDFASIRKTISRVYLKHGIPIEVIADYQDPATLYAKMYDRGRSYLSEKEIAEMQKEVNAEVIEFELKAIDDAQVIPGSVETLKWLKDKGKKIGLVTINSEASALKFTEKTGIKDFIDAFCCRDSPGRPKPYPDHVLACLKELDCRSDEAILVGDHIDDMLAAKAAGVYAVCIPNYRSQIYTEEELKAAGANEIIDNINELPEIIRKLERE